MTGLVAAVVAALAVLVAVALAVLVLLSTHRSRKRVTTMPIEQTTDSATLLPPGFDDETSEFYVHPELRPHYRAERADREVDKEAVFVMLKQAAEADVARRVASESNASNMPASSRIFTRREQPAGIGYFMNNAAWRQSHENAEPTDEQMQLAEHTVRLRRAQADALRERQAAEYRRQQVAQMHCRVCHDEDDLDTTVLTLVDGSQVRAHRRCGVAASAALLAGVSDVERAAAADYVQATTGGADRDGDGEPVRWTVRSPGRPRVAAGALDAAGSSHGDGPGRSPLGRGRRLPDRPCLIAGTEHRYGFGPTLHQLEWGPSTQAANRPRACWRWWNTSQWRPR